MEDNFGKYESGGLEWIVREGYRDLMEIDFTDGSALKDTDENNVRIRGFIDFKGERLFVKAFKERDRFSPLPALKEFLFGHGAKREFEASRYLAKRGIDTPGVIAVGLGPLTKSRAVIVFRNIDGALRLDEFFRDLSGDAESERGERGRLIELLAEVTANLHAASFHHRDYHSGNILVEGWGKKRKLVVIDLHRSSFPRKMGGKRALKNIAAVCHSLKPGLGEGDIRELLRRYREVRGDNSPDIERSLKLIAGRISKMERVRLKSRTKRCFKNSSEFSAEKDGGKTIYRRREADTGKLMGIIGEFSAGGGRLLKEDKKARIALFERDAGDVCVKGYENLSVKEKVWAALGRSRGHVSWRSARGLAVRGFNTPLPLALVIVRRFCVPKKIYFITESLGPARELDRFILSAFKENQNGKEGLVDDLARMIGSLHRMGIYHRDLKGTNIGVKKKGKGYIFSLIDLDDVSFTLSVNARRRARNLSQLYLSTPKVIGAGDRRAFFERYLDAAGGGAGRGKIKRGVEKIVRGEDLLFVSDKGDVIEDGEELFLELFGGG